MQNPLSHPVGAWLGCYRARRVVCAVGRVPEALRARGAEVCFGGQDAWGSIETGAGQLAEAVRKMLRLYGCERVNIIAHSKGGLEARHLISAMGYGKYVASLTMLSTPNRGSRVAELLLYARPGVAVWARGNDAWWRRGGDRNPDALRAGEQLTPAYLRNLTAPIRTRTAFIIKAGVRGWAKTTRMPQCG